MIKAIETTYKGHRFRSRLEARWAIFFDALGFHWQYEPQGFEIDGVCYLPDFFVVMNREKRTEYNRKNPFDTQDEDRTHWFEIKPTNELSDDDFRKCMAFTKSLPVPGFGAYQNFSILAGQPYEYVVQSHTSAWKETPEGFGNYGDCFTECPMCNTFEIRNPKAAGYGHDIDGIDCMWCDVVDRDHKNTDDVFFHKGNVFATDSSFFVASPRLLRAYQAAKSARFEHGETPR